MVAKISKVTKSSPEELQDLTESLRYILDDLNEGKIQGLFFVWVGDGRWSFDWAKARGVDKLQLVGAISTALVEMQSRLLEDKDVG